MYLSGIRRKIRSNYFYVLRAGCTQPMNVRNPLRDRKSAVSFSFKFPSFFKRQPFSLIFGIVFQSLIFVIKVRNYPVPQ